MTRPIKYRTATIRKTPHNTYAVTLHRDGKPHRKNCKTIALARAWIDETVDSLDRRRRPLTPDELDDARRALELLPKGVTLVEVVQYWLGRHKFVTETVTVSNAIENMMADKAAEQLRRHSFYTLRQRLAKFATYFGDRLITDVTSENISAWLSDWSGTTRNNYRREVHSLFAWAIKQRLAYENPVERIPKVRTEQAMPGILSVADLKKFLYVAETNDPALCPAIAIAAFAGLRSEEILRLKASDIAGDVIRLEGAATKTRQRRLVTVSDNLSSWLSAYAPAKQLRVSDHIRRMARLRKIADLLWPRNALRHSFATYHLALHNDAAKTAHELGHGSSDMLYRHYRALATKDEGRAYFKIFPAKKPQTLS